MVFLAFCLAATLLVGVTSSAEYDPWCDINDDGLIDIVDIVSLAIRFGEEGTPINKAAVQFEGNISIPAAAFVPCRTDKDWRNSGHTLHNYEDTGQASFVAQVQLPHGANLTRLIIYWYDSGLDGVSCILVQNNLTSGYIIATAGSTGSAGDGSSYDDVESVWATVDNNKYAYYLAVAIPASPPEYYVYRFFYAMIEYTYL